MRRITRGYRIRTYPNGVQRRLRDQDSAFRNFFASRAQYPRFKRCPEEILAQVLAEGDGVKFTRSGRTNRACLEQEKLH